MSWQWRMMKNVKGIDLSFQNWHEKFDKFWPKHSKVSKISILMGAIWPKYIMFELKTYKGVTFHDSEEWCKIWRKKLTCGLENNMRNLANFHHSTLKSQNWNFDGILFSKVESV